MYGPQNLVALNNALQVPTKRASAIFAVTANTGVTASFEGTLDGTNWLAIQAQRTDTGEWVTGVAAGETGAYYVPQSAWKSTRLRQTNSVAGPLTVTADVGLFSAPVQAGQGIYRASPPVLSDRQTAQLLADLLGNLKVTLATNIAGEDRTNGRMLVRQPNIQNACLTMYTGAVAGDQVVTGPAYIDTIVVGVPTNGQNLTVYDHVGLGGGQVLQISLATPGAYRVRLHFNVGIYNVAAGNTGAISILGWFGDGTFGLG